MAGAKLGLIAGAGGLPVEIADASRRVGRPIHVLRLKGMADPALAAHPGEDVGLAELGRCVSILRREQCRRVCFAGIVRRPDFATLMPDLGALRHLPSILAAARGGDDGLLRAVLAAFEAEGFEVEGVGEAAAQLTLGRGLLGEVVPGDSHLSDIRHALQAARAAGENDVGQGAIVRDGILLATEGHDGTDAMLRLCTEVSGSFEGALSGVLAKVPKPRQDRRVDLPTIGVATIELAAQARLAGVAGEAGALLVVDREAVRRAADRLGLFVLGVDGEAA